MRHPAQPRHRFPLARPIAAFLVACYVLATTRPAMADTPAVQPVPYNTSQPVPYAVEAPVTAPAQAPAPPRVVTPVGSDVVHLKDGGMIRGVLIEAIPKDHATVQLGTGQNAIIPWNLIDHIERGAARPPSPSPEESPSAGATATVHVESADPVVMETHDANGDWVFACNSPCDRPLPLANEYRVTGAGMRNTGIFRISANPGESVTIKLNPSSKGAFVGGIVLVSVGPVVTLIGLVVLLVSAVESVCDSANGTSTSTSCGNSSSTGTTGGVLTLGGIAMIVGGIVMIASNSRSGVTQGPSDARPRQDAWRRLPTWHEDPMGQALPRAAATPLFTTTF